MTAKFQKTSLQLSPMVLGDMDNWQGLTRSEALRLSVERGHYLSTLELGEIAGIVNEYAPILKEALKDLGYEDYRLAVRSLPAIVAGFLAEESRAWHYEDGDRHELNPKALLEKLSAMNPVERIGILDCVVAARLKTRPELKTTYEGEELIHRHLWEIVEEEAKFASEREQGWFKSSLVAMVFAFHTVEAYLNYAGERLAPEIWKDERNYFRREPYRGFEGKLRKVLELVKLPWTPDEQPLKTILELKELRDLIAHGKSEKLAGEVRHPQDSEIRFPLSTLRSIVIPKEKLKRTLPDVEQFLDKIHALAAPTVKEIWFGKEALRGPLTYSSGTTILNEP